MSPWRKKGLYLWNSRHSSILMLFIHILHTSDIFGIHIFFSLFMFVYHYITSRLCWVISIRLWQSSCTHRTHQAIMMSSLRQNNVMKSCSRKNDVIFASWVRNCYPPAQLSVRWNYSHPTHWTSVARACLWLGTCWFWLISFKVAPWRSYWRYFVFEYQPRTSVSVGTNLFDLSGTKFKIIATFGLDTCHHDKRGVMMLPVNFEKTTRNRNAKILYSPILFHTTHC